MVGTCVVYLGLVVCSRIPDGARSTSKCSCVPHIDRSLRKYNHCMICISGHPRDCDACSLTVGRVWLRRTSILRQRPHAKLTVCIAQYGHSPYRAAYSTTPKRKKLSRGTRGPAYSLSECLSRRAVDHASTWERMGEGGRGGGFLHLTLDGIFSSMRGSGQWELSRGRLTLDDVSPNSSFASESGNNGEGLGRRGTRSNIIIISHGV